MVAKEQSVALHLQQALSELQDITAHCADTGLLGVHGCPDLERACLILVLGSVTFQRDLSASVV
jgi:hypothetical protein